MNKKNGKTKPIQKDLNPIRCRSFLLRLWCTDELGDFNWQASLENPETGVRIGFACLEDLFVYLMDLATAYK